MTGTIGFLIGAAAIASFAATSFYAYRFADPRKLHLFVTAFGLFAVAMVLWAVAVASGNAIAVTRLLYASDALLLAGTVAMAMLLWGRQNVILNVGLGSLAALLLSLRAFDYTPTGYVHDGLLYFNLTGGVRTVILLSFVLIWLPAMIQMAFSVARDPLLFAVRNALTSCFTALVFVTAFFLSAKRAAVIVPLFAFIAALFLIMSILNVLIMRAGRSSAEHAATPKKGKVSHASARQ